VPDAVVTGRFSAKASLARGAFAIAVHFASFAVGTRRTAVSTAILIRFRRVLDAISAGGHLTSAGGASAIDAVRASVTHAPERARVAVAPTTIDVGFIRVNSTIRAMLRRNVSVAALSAQVGVAIPLRESRIRCEA